MDLLEKFHERCFEVTGDTWCPYPSEIFMKVVMKVDDETARELIAERRTFLFPSFLMGEPMLDDLRKYIDR